MDARRKLLGTRWPALTLALGALALLIWLKLRVVTGVPRTAYADPHEHEQKPSQSQSARAAPAHEDAATLGALSSSGPAPR